MGAKITDNTDSARTRTYRRPPFAKGRIAMISVLALLVGFITTASTPPEAAEAAVNTTSGVTFGIGSTELAVPKSGSRYIYVSTSGSDTHTEYKADWSPPQSWAYQRLSCLTNPTWATDSSQDVCPEPTISNPLRTIKTAMRVAKPGDVIVVRGGTYNEGAGYGIQRGTASKPITLQNMPGETVRLNGTLLMKYASYWTIQGFRISYNSAIQTGQAVVQFAGGDGWQFINNEVRGSTGVANVMVNSGETNSTSVAGLRAAGPNNYTIAGNCIHSQNGTGARGLYHNIYLLSGIYSSGGLIERNLLASAPRGANIKVAGSSRANANQSPNDVDIRFNTLLNASSGITLGLKTQNILIERNIIAFSNNSTQYDGGIKTYQFDRPTATTVRDNVISRYNKTIEEDGGVRTPLANVNTITDPVTRTGSLTDCSASVNPSWIKNGFGHLASTTDGRFIDDNRNPHEASIEALAAAGITSGCKEGYFCANQNVTREAMAAFLRRSLDLPYVSRDYFSDDSLSPFQKDINALAAAGITTGCSATNFCPKQNVTREQMALFLVRAFDYPATSRDYFTDDETTSFENSINALAAAGITSGCATGRFCPKDPVKRDAMAAFLARALDL